MLSRLRHPHRFSPTCNRFLLMVIALPNRHGGVSRRPIGRGQYEEAENAAGTGWNEVKLILSPCKRGCAPSKPARRYLRPMHFHRLYIRGESALGREHRERISHELDTGLRAQRGLDK